MERLAEIQVVSHLLFQLPKRTPMPYGPLDPRLVQSLLCFRYPAVLLKV